MHKPQYMRNVTPEWMRGTKNASFAVVAFGWTFFYIPKQLREEQNSSKVHVNENISRICAYIKRKRRKMLKCHHTSVGNAITTQIHASCVLSTNKMFINLPSC